MVLKSFLLVACTCAWSAEALSQSKMDQETTAIVAEGKKLYKSEMASWYGTDVFIEAFPERKAQIGGYFSYEDGDRYSCLFYSKGDNPKVIGLVSFDSSFSTTNSRLDSTFRNFSPAEKEIFGFRKVALDEVNADKMFKMFPNTNYNLIPIVTDGIKKVFIITGPQQGGNVIIGNDYLLTFDKNNRVKLKKKLHQSFLEIPWATTDEGTVTMHTHQKETGSYITATDVCTLMLYEHFAKWQQHIVISADYVCTWNCETNELLTLTRKAWDNIERDMEKRGKL